MGPKNIISLNSISQKLIFQNLMCWTSKPLMELYSICILETLLGLYAPELWYALRGGGNSRELPKNLIGKKIFMWKVVTKKWIFNEAGAGAARRDPSARRAATPASFFGLCDGVPPANRGTPHVPKLGTWPSATYTMCVVAVRCMPLVHNLVAFEMWVCVHGM
jgi:hypothetical protein